ncbi:XRE family transcriptional regulator [Butyricimonas paravirosa]|uniref:XRE family transcriptional regulator n=1 Tax=Butyricimonas paravirosa TaxID=1472417 RepID=UPI00210A74B4|nr:XRE family transcriptional regulator [Butyricimonas paravirosa]MCQ4875839.1 XRE family transcriptional regulator [Butyricimonas paravirosa]
MSATQDKKNKKTEIEIFVINKVKEYRIAAKLSKRKLSLELRLNHNYVNNVEDPKSPAKYNLNQLNELAKIFKCTIADFMPTPFMQKDTIEEYMDLHPKIKAKYEIMAKKYEEEERKKLEEKERKKKEKAKAKTKKK